MGYKETNVSLFFICSFLNNFLKHDIVIITNEKGENYVDICLRR